MTSDAWKLQGMDGAVPVTSGQTFTGLSRGFDIVDAAVIDFEVVRPDGVSVSVAPGGTYPIGASIRGPIGMMAVTSGIVLVYPESATYTVA